MPLHLQIFDENFATKSAGYPIALNRVLERLNFVEAFLRQITFNSLYFETSR